MYEKLRSEHEKLLENDGPNFLIQRQVEQQKKMELDNKHANLAKLQEELNSCKEVISSKEQELSNINQKIESALSERKLLREKLECKKLEMEARELQRKAIQFSHNTLSIQDQITHDIL